MPTQIKPIFPERQQQRLVLPKGFEWLRSQPKDPRRYSVGIGGYRPDSMGGGIGQNSAAFLARWQNTGLPDPPRLTESILNGRNKPKTGALLLNLVDPNATLTELTGSYLGRDRPLVGTGGEVFSPLEFLKSKGITLEGTGETGVPARLTDYNLAPFIAVGEMLSGAPMPDNPDPDMPYEFQRDPAYWTAVAIMADDQIERAAYRIVERTADPTTNKYLLDELTAQLKRDRDRAMGYTSGNKRVDYLAKTDFWHSVLSQQEAAKGAGGYRQMFPEGDVYQIPRLGAAAIPFIGTELAEMAKPITPEIEDAWRRADPAIRAKYLEDAGWDTAAADIIVGLKLGGVAGAWASAAKGATGVPGAAYKVYSAGLKASKITMATGLTSAMTHWTLVSAWPEDFDLGPITGEGVAEYRERVDLARPISSSYLAGMVNAMGFWSSATYGAATAVMGGKRLAATAGTALKSRGIPVPMPGAPARRILTYGFGGPAMTRYATEGLGLNPQGIVNSQRRTLMSEVINSGRDRIHLMWESRLQKARAGDAMDGMTSEQIAELASQHLSREIDTAVRDWDVYLGLDTAIRKGRPILDDFEIRQFNNAVRNLRSIDDAVAQRYVSQYGAEFVTRVAGQDTPEAIHGFLTKLVRDLGGTPEGLPDPGSATRDLEWWHQLTRTVYEYAYDRWTGLVHAKAEGTDEFEKLGVVTARHAWKDLIDESLPILRKGGQEAADRMERLAQTIEVEEWLSRGRVGTAEWHPTPEMLADFLEDLRPVSLTRRRLPSPDADTAGDPLNLIHKQINDQGLWELAYKPVDEAGEFIASVTTRTGQTFRTRWFDYPLSNADNIEMGNRGFIMQKLEGLTQGYRTWRILEYQKGALFRSLSAKGVGTPTQIADFHNGVMRLSRKHALSPQAVGRAPTWVPGMQAMADEVEALATKIFGKGPHINKATGKPIEWRREIGNAYRTAYRLNLTTGLTSHLKSLPGGEAITLASDFIYVAWRFGLSPLFKAGELWESFQLALMRRVNPWGDPNVEALYYRTGIGNDPNTIAVELQGDMLLQSMTHSYGVGKALAPHEHTVPTVLHSSTERAAASLSFMSRFLYEDVAAMQQRLALKASAERFRQRALGGQALRSVNRHEALVVEMADLIDDAGNILPGSEVRAREILSELDFEELDWPTRAALEAWPEGAPTAEALQRAARLDETAAFLRREQAALDERGLDGTTPEWHLAQYEHLIDNGMLPRDPRIELRKRYKATIDEIEAAFGVNRRMGHQVNRELLVDPVTGNEIPELAGPNWPAGRDVDRVLRSLRSRMGHVRVELPSYEDMALRVEARAQALRSPVPVTRNARVGPVPPEGFSDDPADIFVRGQENPEFEMYGPNAGQGVTSWLEPDAANRGLWHTTTNLDAVMDTGLLSRMELAERATPTEAVDAIVQAYAKGTPAHELHVERWDGTFVGIDYRQIEALQSGSFLLRDNWTGNEVLWDEIRRIKDDSGNVLWQNKPGTAAPRGLGAHHIDRMVSTTTDYIHAQTIAERLSFLSRVARDEMDADDILSHFAQGYDYFLTGGDLATVTEMADALGLPHVVTSPDAEVAWEQLARAIDRGARQAADPADYLFKSCLALDSHLNRAVKEAGHEGFTGGVILILSKEQAARIDPAQVGIVRVAARMAKPTPLDPEAVIQALGDAVVANRNNRFDVFVWREEYGREIYSLHFPVRATDDEIREAVRDLVTDAARDSRGVVGVADNTDVLHPVTVIGEVPDMAKVPRVGPDQFELQFDSNDVFVLDDRIVGEPLASDELGLLRQHRQTIDDDGNTIPGLEQRQQEVDDRLMELKAEAIDPDPATSMDEVYGTPEHFTENLIEAVDIRRKLQGLPSLREMGHTFWNPVEFKEGLAQKQVIQMMREEFPLFLPKGPRAVFEKVAGAEKDWADWLVKDRELYDRWHATMNPDDLDALIAHAGGDPERRSLDALYASEDWATISTLWAINGKAASEEAFATHFFDQYRSPILRSINHPVLGIYPASWALKTAREWVRFLFDNRMFGQELRLGMSPAIALANITKQQATAFAMQEGVTGDLNSYLEDGPLGSTLFIFNLLMPGDWSSIPFPLSRTLREIVRGNLDASTIFQRNVDYLGVTRDNRLFWESLGEIGDVATGAVNTEGKFVPATVLEDGTYAKPRKPPSWTEPNIYEDQWAR